MSTSATGTIQDEAGHGVPGISVVLEDISVLFDQTLDKQKQTDGNGQFTFNYADDFFAFDGSKPRQLRLRLLIGRHVLKELTLSDVKDAALAIGTIKVNSKSLGWLATSVKGSKLDDDTGTPSRWTSGNAVEWLVDNVAAWGRVAELLDTATKSQTAVDLMQLTIDVKPFQTSKTVDEQDPDVVLSFSPPLAAGNKLVSDKRIEKMLLAASDKGAQVRIQLSAIGGPSTVAWGDILGAAGVVVGSGLVLAGLIALFVAAFGVVALVLSIAATTAGLVFGLRKVIRSLPAGTNRSDVERVTTWFADAHASRVTVRPFYNHIACWTHGKLILNENNQCILLGSPFEQSYFDSPEHALDNPMRGDDAGKGPIHDTSVAVRGPALKDLQEVFDLHWRVADPSDQLPLNSTVPAELTSNNLITRDRQEYLCSVQVVRTLNTKTFPASTFQPSGTDGEQGILEAYLRAIQFAEKLIYIENQYFVQDDVIDAIIDVMRAKPALQLILLLNAVPDVPFYPGWQRAALRRIAQALAPASGSVPQQSPRWGVFTAWCHAGPSPAPSKSPSNKQRLRNFYLHTKTAIIDNVWATIGSANLDGVSLDRFQLEPIFHNRSSETNCVFFEEAKAGGAAEATDTAKAIDMLRRQLWSEHLGIGPLTSPLLDVTNPPLELWRAQAETNRLELNVNSANMSGIHILEWKPDFQVSEPAKMHLGTEGVVPTPFDVVEEGPSYDFVQGQWKK